MITPPPDAAFDWLPASGAPRLVCRPLLPIARHFFTTRAWRLGSASCADGWGQIADAIGADPESLLRARQVHGAGVLVHRAGRRPPPGAAADIIAGDDGAVALAIQTADCVPLLIADQRTGAVAAAHAGWRGTALRVAAAAVGSLMDAFGSDPSDLVAAIGPSIGPCCYQVGGEVRDRFASEGFRDRELARWFSKDAAHLAANPMRPPNSGTAPADAAFLDLWTATRDQLEAAGLPRAQIFAAELCTASHAEAFCSYRRDGQKAGRLAAVIRTLAPRSG